MGRPRWSRSRSRSLSLRSEARRSALGAVPPEKEAEFPAVCSGGRGLLTPRKPEKNAAGSGGSHFIASVVIDFFYIRGLVRFSYERRGSDG